MPWLGKLEMPRVHVFVGAMACSTPTEFNAMAHSGPDPLPSGAIAASLGVRVIRMGETGRITVGDSFGRFHCWCVSASLWVFLYNSEGSYLFELWSRAVQTPFQGSWLRTVFLSVL